MNGGNIDQDTLATHTKLKAQAEKAKDKEESSEKLDSRRISVDNGPLVRSSVPQNKSKHDVL